MAFNRWTILSLVVLALGVLYWLWMGTTYNNWTDVGVYAIGVVMIGFGLVGAWASMNLPAEKSA